MPRAFRFRLYPNQEQEKRLLNAIEASRILWNDALSHRESRWRRERLSTSYKLQQSILTQVRHTDPLIGGLYSQVAQNVLRRLDNAFQAFFKGQSGYPKTKKFSASGSICYPQAYNGSAKPDAQRKRLFLSKIGNIRTVFHRPLPKEARLKTCTVLRERDGKWFASLVYEDIVPLQTTSFRSLFTSPVGVDLGLKAIIATSDGEKFEHPRFLRKAERRLKRLNADLSRKRAGSKNREKSRRRLAAQHVKVVNQRADFNQKLSTRLVASHSLVVFEKLRIGNMTKNRKLAKSIHDAGWGQLVKFSEYKAPRWASRVVKVPAAYSSQECHSCGTRNHLSLEVREFECAGCRRTLDRDINAAKVVLSRGLLVLGMVGRDSPNLRPAETRPPPPQTTEGASQVVESGTICDNPSRLSAGTPRPRSREDVTPAPGFFC